MNTFKKLLNLQDKSGNFYTHRFGAFHLKKQPIFISLTGETLPLLPKSLYKYKHFIHPFSHTCQAKKWQLLNRSGAHRLLNQ